MSDLRLTPQDIDYIARVVDTEVSPAYARAYPEEYAAMVRGVIDTVMNRVASTGFPNTVVGVLNDPRAFSKITGPARLNPYGSVQNTPQAQQITQDLVESHAKARAQGLPSTIGAAVNYANPAFSDRVNLDSWVNPMIAAGAVKLGIEGLRDYNHFHGIAPGAIPPDPFSISYDPAATPANMNQYGFTFDPSGMPSLGIDGQNPQQTWGFDALTGETTWGAPPTPEFSPIGLSPDLAPPAPAFDPTGLGFDIGAPQAPAFDPTGLGFDIGAPSVPEPSGPFSTSVQGHLGSLGVGPAAPVSGPPMGTLDSASAIGSYGPAQAPAFDPSSLGFDIGVPEVTGPIQGPSAPPEDYGQPAIEGPATPQVGETYDFDKQLAPGTIVNAEMVSPTQNRVTGLGQPTHQGTLMGTAIPGIMEHAKALFSGAINPPTATVAPISAPNVQQAIAGPLAGLLGGLSGIGGLFGGNAGGPLSPGAMAAGWSMNNPESHYGGYGGGYDPTPV